MTPDQAEAAFLLAREALAKADQADQRAVIVADRLNERTGAIKERVDDIAQAQRDGRDEARHEHEVQTRALAHMRKDLEKILEGNAKAVNERLDGFATALAGVQTSVTAITADDAGADRQVERQKLSNARLSMWITGGTLIAGSLTAIVIAIIQQT